MKWQTVVCIVMLLSVGCQARKHAPIHAPAQAGASLSTSSSATAYSGANGEPCQNAIVVAASNETQGIRFEYDWIATHYPGYRVKSQALLAEDGKSFDLISFTTSDGEEKATCFDITGFFGKW